MKLTIEIKDRLAARGVETLHGAGVNIADDLLMEPPCSIKWMNTGPQVSLGAFSYAVSGFYSAVSIGRYTSIGEQVQIGRANHPLDWASTSPFFYLREKLFAIGNDFDSAGAYHAYSAPTRSAGPATAFKPIRIGNDVYIGHGACIMPGVTIGDGAVVGAMAVVSKNVPPYAIVAGNPATIRRFRLPMEIAGRLLTSKWWRFAPWQLSDVDFSNPAASIDLLLAKIADLVPYEAEKLRFADVATPPAAG